MCWVLSGVCAAAVAILSYGIYKFAMDCLDEDDEGDEDPNTAPRYNLRIRPTRPAIDTSIYNRY